MTFRRTRAIFRKELWHILRDPRSLASALGQPLIMLIIFGWALSLDLDHIPTVIYDLDQTPQSLDLVRDFGNSPGVGRLHHAEDLYRRSRRPRTQGNRADGHFACRGVVNGQKNPHRASVVRERPALRS